MKTLSFGALIMLVAHPFAELGGQAPPPKPPVGIPADAVHVNGRWFRVYLEKCGWKTARDKCARLGGQLAVIHNQATQTTIATLSPGLRLWLGATDEKVEGLWVWVDGTTMDFKAWAPRNPSNSKRNEHFLHRIPDGTWNDAPEGEPVAGFICEWRGK